MTEKSFPGPMSMIKIDGQKIKTLREQQGLTQLYLATAVDVTTDTISRWENKRYPSIKKENGIRLAEALEVELEEILDNQLETVAGNETTAEPAQTTQPQSDKPGETSVLKKSWPILILSGTLFAVILAFLFSYFDIEKDITVTATRLIPTHFIAGQPFPVIVELSGNSDKEVAFILKESLPPGATILQTLPVRNGKNDDNPSLKWITKSVVPATFFYLIKTGKNQMGDISFTGTIATAGGDAQPVRGSSILQPGQHHWADTDTDNIISDKEILTVYDKYAKLQGLEDEIDLIEEIWLGEGYSWNPATEQFDITQ